MFILPVQHLKTTLEQEAGNTENELHCIPEYRSEDLVNTVKQIGKTVRFTLKDEKKCIRIAKHNKSWSWQQYKLYSTKIKSWRAIITFQIYLFYIFNYEYKLFISVKY